MDSWTGRFGSVEIDGDELRWYVSACGDLRYLYHAPKTLVPPEGPLVQTTAEFIHLGPPTLAVPESVLREIRSCYADELPPLTLPTTKESEECAVCNPIPASLALDREPQSFDDPAIRAAAQLRLVWVCGLGACAPSSGISDNGYALARCPSCGTWYRYYSSCFRDVMCHLFDFYLRRLTPAFVQHELAGPPGDDEAELFKIYRLLLGYSSFPPPAWE